ncbi:DUF742 domain-containing protein [Streptomyces olivaceus]
MNSRSGPSTSADEAASIVRLYSVTDGRTRPRHNLTLHTVLGPGPRPPRAVPEESERIVRLCQERGRPLVELAGSLRLHVAAVSVLVSDLIDAGALSVPVPERSGESGEVQTLLAISAAFKRRFPGARSKAG